MQLCVIELVLFVKDIFICVYENGEFILHLTVDRCFIFAEILMYCMKVFRIYGDDIHIHIHILDVICLLLHLYVPYIIFRCIITSSKQYKYKSLISCSINKSQYTYDMEHISTIQKIYESMNINTSVLVCDSNIDLCLMVEELEKKNFPCVSLSTSTQKELDNYPNKMITSTPDEFKSQYFWQTVSKYSVECIFFVGMNSFKQCFDTWLGQKHTFRHVPTQQYIFHLG